MVVVKPLAMFMFGRVNLAPWSMLNIVVAVVAVVVLSRALAELKVQPVARSVFHRLVLLAQPPAQLPVVAVDLVTMRSMDNVSPRLVTLAPVAPVVVAVRTVPLAAMPLMAAMVPPLVAAQVAQKVGGSSTIQKSTSSPREPLTAPLGNF